MKGDSVIWIVAVLLGIISLIVVYSATSALVFNNYGGNTGKLLMKHSGTLLIGFLMMLLGYKIDYRHYAKASRLLLVPCLALLLYTLLFGRNINQASRAINIFGISFQPSEVSKIILITYLARQMVMMGDRIHKLKDVLLQLGLPILLTALLIFPENLSTAAILVTASLVLLFVGRVKFLHLMVIVGIAVAGLGLYLLYDAAKTSIGNKKAEKTFVENTEGVSATFKPKQNRIRTWSNRLSAIGQKDKEYDPFDDHHYQQTYAKIAVATSSVFGKGPGKSEQRNFLPHPYSDFIFAIIIEEYGLAGAILVLLLYIILFTRVLRIVSKRPFSFGALMAFGLAFLIILQAMINMGVSIGLLPVTGQPLPFVSMGGTSMMATGFIIGMILSLTRNIEEEENEAHKAEEDELETLEPTETTDETDESES